MNEGPQWVEGRHCAGVLVTYAKAMTCDPCLLEAFEENLRGLPVSSVWRGHGSAIFLEFGRLTPGTRRDGTPAEPDGEFGLMIEWSWRIEGPSTILCGSWSDEALWELTFQQMLGRTVVGLSTSDACLR